MKESGGTSWKLIQKKFQISFMEVQQVQRYQTMMKKQKQGPVGQLKRKKYRSKES
jgi:hypothetical protein